MGMGPDSAPPDHPRALGSPTDAASTTMDAERRAQLGLRLVGWVLIIEAASFLLSGLIWRLFTDLYPLSRGLNQAVPLLDLLAAVGVSWYARGWRWASPARARAARVAVGMFWTMFGLSVVITAAGPLGSWLQLWPPADGRTDWWLISLRIFWSCNLLAAITGYLCLLAGFDIHPGWRWTAVGVLIIRTVMSVLYWWGGLRLDLGPWLGLTLDIAWFAGFLAVWAVVFFLQSRRSPVAADAKPAWVPVVRRGLVHYRRALLGRILVLLVGVLALVLAALARSPEAALGVGLVAALAGLAMAGWSMLGIAMQQAVPPACGLRAPARTALALGVLGLLADCSAVGLVLEALASQRYGFNRNFAGGASSVLNAAGLLLGLATFVALLIFIGRLARQAGREALTAVAGRLLGWVVGLAIGMLLLYLMIWFGRPPGLLLLVVALGLLIMGIVLVVRYIGLLVGLEDGLAEMASAETFE